MTNPEIPERTRGGFAGKIAGRLKEAAGSAIGNRDMAREGRLQQAQVDAEADAEVAEERADQAELEAERKENELERERLETEIAAREREERIERDRREAQIAAEAEERRQKEHAGRKERLQERGAHLAERAAEAERVAAAQQAARLEQEARAAEANADAIDPEER